MIWHGRFAYTCLDLSKVIASKTLYFIIEVVHMLRAT